MKRDDLFSKLKKPLLYSAFPAVLFAAYGAMTTATPVAPPQINLSGVLADTLPGDTIDPQDQDTTGYSEESDTSAFPTEDNFPADTAGDAFPADTAGAGEGFEPSPADTNGFRP